MSDKLSLTELAWEIQDKHKFSFWDSLIISAALAQNCKILYSEDLVHEMKILDLVILNPFK